MGISCSKREQSDYVIYVTTGDKKYAGTDATVRMILYDEDGKKSEEITLNNTFQNNFESGKTDVFYVPRAQNVQLGNISKIEFWRTNFGSAWFVDRVVVKNRVVNDNFVFPVLRWIKPNHHYMIKHLDTSLPQFDEHKQHRAQELTEKKRTYEYVQNGPGMPAQIKSLPDDEQFSLDYAFHILSSKLLLKTKGFLADITSGKWESFDDVMKVYDKETFVTPKFAELKGWEDDIYFANQRLSGANNIIIKLCTSIPDKLPVTEEMLKPLLEGNSFQTLLNTNRIFICDLEILDGLECKQGRVLCSPIALFMVDNENQLRPIAIQLFQKPASDNPIFFPTDDPHLWTLVKMWYNNADSSFHQALTHLGFTHLTMEGIAVSVNRNLSLSHPIYKILAPHFMYLIAINCRALKLLTSEGGWIDKTMNIGSKGIIGLTVKGVSNWSMDVEGTLPHELKRRGLDDTNVLPGYHYREDSLLLYDAIHKYASRYVDLYYDTDDKISGDWELLAWAKEMALEIENGGAGMKGVPNDGDIKTKEDVVKIITCIIYTSSVTHAAANFPQYESYGFPPNYPATMHGTPPTTKAAVNEGSLLDCLATKEIIISTMVVCKLLSSKATQSLGDFEVQYIFDPKALELVSQFREDLKNISTIIKDKNTTRKFPYDTLDPDSIPNAISI